MSQWCNPPTLAPMVASKDLVDHCRSLRVGVQRTGTTLQAALLQPINKIPQKLVSVFLPPLPEVLCNTWRDHIRWSVHNCIDLSHMPRLPGFETQLTQIGVKTYLWGFAQWAWVSSHRWLCWRPDYSAVVARTWRKTPGFDLEGRRRVDTLDCGTAAPKSGDKAHVSFIDGPSWIERWAFSSSCCSYHSDQGQKVNEYIS